MCFFTLKIPNVFRIMELINLIKNHKAVVMKIFIIYMVFHDVVENMSIDSSRTVTETVAEQSVTAIKF